MNILLLLAGGSGNRLGADIPKQFLTVKDAPVIVHTLRHFQDSPLIDAICIASHRDWMDDVKGYARDYGIDKIRWVVPGGNTGLESVKQGIDALMDVDDESLILIHDSVRPFISEVEIEDNIRVARLHDVAVTSVPCVETLVRTDKDGRANQHIPRDGIMRVMTPQTFRLRILRELFSDKDAATSGYPSTFALYMSKGFPVFCSHGNERNVKITYPEDLDFLYMRKYLL